MTRFGITDALAAAREHAARVPLHEIDVSRPELYQTDTQGPYFERLRREAPVHWCANSAYGGYWSLSQLADMQTIDGDVARFSADTSIAIVDQAGDFTMPMFIAMDPPKHDVQRMAVAPVVAPRNLAALESTIRARAGAILDSLPVGETFDWVERVSIELTSQMLATLFDFPLEERRQLIEWSDLLTGGASAEGKPRGYRREQLLACLARFTRMWHEKAQQPPGNDMVSMLVHGEGTRDLVERPMELLGNIILLVIGGNDTTRNSISGGVLALNRFPGEYEKLRANPKLIPNMVAEIIRWQSPVLHIRRTATQDVEFRGQHIRKGDKVVMWYVSGNRDETVFDDADAFRIDRANARQHTSFGWGIHRCMGNRLAEMQLRVLWEEILPRFHAVEVVGPETRVRSNLIRGIASLPVRLHRH